jgi:hypothetical protein
MTIAHHRTFGLESAPKVRNAKAWGNAPGNKPRNSSALKARNEPFIATTEFPVPIPRFQRFSCISILDLGRWPRLLHHAPLALTGIDWLITQVRHCLKDQPTRYRRWY